jgi:hypothetical protein
MGAMGALLVPKRAFRNSINADVKKTAQNKSSEKYDPGDWSLDIGQPFIGCVMDHKYLSFTKKKG